MSDSLPQLCRLTPEEAYEEYGDYLETDGEIDPQKVKEVLVEYDWLYRNYQSLLMSELQDHFSKVGTHASWVIAAIVEKFNDTMMYEVEELIEILEAGGFMGSTPAETVREYFEYDEWRKQRGTRS